MTKRERGWRLWGRRIGWLVVIWTLGVAAVAVGSRLIRVLMQAAGMRG